MFIVTRAAVVLTPSGVKCVGVPRWTWNSWEFTASRSANYKHGTPGVQLPYPQAGQTTVRLLIS